MLQIEAVLATCSVHAVTETLKPWPVDGMLAIRSLIVFSTDDILDFKLSLRYWPHHTKQFLKGSPRDGMVREHSSVSHTSSSASCQLSSKLNLGRHSGLVQGDHDCIYDHECHIWLP